MYKVSNIYRTIQSKLTGKKLDKIFWTLIQDLDSKGHTCFTEIARVVLRTDTDGVAGGEECGTVPVHALCALTGVKDGCQIKVNPSVINTYFTIFL